MKRFLYLLIQFTWGLGPAIIGFLYFLRYIRCPYRFYRLFVKSGFKVTACDISKDAINHLRKWEKAEGVDIRSVQADMKALPFADNAFDCIFAYHVISHTDTEGFAEIMKEIKRILRPNGKIFFTLCSKEPDGSDVPDEEINSA